MSVSAALAKASFAARARSLSARRLVSLSSHFSRSFPSRPTPRLVPGPPQHSLCCPSSLPVSILLGWPTLTPFSFSASSSPSFESLHSTVSGYSGAASRRPLSTSAMASGETGVVVVYVTVPNKEAGQKLATSIIEQKLAACVNRIPGLESTYFWEGKVETSAEELLIIKTRQALLDPLSEHVKANHPYDLPEFIALPVVAGSEGYLKWVVDNTKESSP